MTKNDYLQKLADALITDEEGKQAVLRFYEELIEDRMESGMTEDEAVADMEQIDDLAGRLNAEFASISDEKKDDDTEEDAGDGSANPFPFEIDTDELGRMGKDALKAMKKLLKGAAAGVTKAASGVSGMIRSTAAGQVPEDRADQAVEAVEKEADAAADAMTDAVEAVENALDAAGEKTETAEETAAGEDAAGKTGDNSSADPMDQVRELAEKLNEKLNAATGSAKGFFRQVAEGFSKLIGEVAAKAGEQTAAKENAPAEEAGAASGAGDAAGDAGRAVECAVEEAETALQNAQEQLRQAAETLADNEAVQQAAEELSAAAEDAAENVKETVEFVCSEACEDDSDEDGAGSAGQIPPQGWTAPAGNPFEESSGDDSVYRRMEFTCDSGTVKGASLFPCDFPVKIAPSGDDRIHLTYYTHPRDVYTAAVSDGVLTLTHNGKRRVRATFSFFNSLFSVLKGNSENAFEEIRLLVPADWNGDITVRNSNARVSVEELFGPGRMDVRTSNGAVALKGLKAKAVTAGSSNGRVTAEGVESEGDMKLSSSNGAIRTNNLKCGGKLDMTTSNGAVEMIDVTAGEIRADTSNAAIRVDHIAAGSYDLCTGNGAVSGVMPGKQEDYAISSHTSNGKNSLPENSSGAIPFRVRTSNGAISITFAGV